MDKNVFRINFFVGISIIFVTFLKNYAAVLYHADYDFFSRLLNAIRFFFYLGFFMIWGMSVRKRVVQPYLRRLISIITFLLPFWLVIREVKFRFAITDGLLRYLWYMYYIPFLLIPMLIFCVSIFLGKSETEHLPKWIYPFWAITFVLICIVLTNDLHQLTFRFPDNSTSWTDAQYEHGWMYYVVAFWMLFCSVSAFGMILIKSRIPRSRRSFWLPALPFFVAIIYTVLYNAGVPLIKHAFGDVVVFFCLVFIGFFEACIFCGLIPSNTHYMSLFQTLKDTSIWITDDTYQVYYERSSGEILSKQDMVAVSKEGTLPCNGKQLHNMRIKGGHVIWTEDISELLHLREELEERKEELKERGDLLQYEYEKEREHRVVKEQNRLYDLLQKKTQKQMDRIYDLVQKYYIADAIEEKQRILAVIIVLGTYIKRRRDFILVANAGDTLSEKNLENALKESFYGLRYFNIRGGFLVQTEHSPVPEEIWASVYDLFEEVVEEVIEKEPVRVHFIHVRIGEIKDTVRANISMDGYSSKKEFFCGKYQELTVNRDDDGTEFVFSWKGGGV